MACSQTKKNNRIFEFAASQLQVRKVKKNWAIPVTTRFLCASSKIRNDIKSFPSVLFAAVVKQRCLFAFFFLNNPSVSEHRSVKTILSNKKPFRLQRSLVDTEAPRALKMSHLSSSNLTKEQERGACRDGAGLSFY